MPICAIRFRLQLMRCDFDRPVHVFAHIHAISRRMVMPKVSRKAEPCPTVAQRFSQFARIFTTASVKVTLSLPQYTGTLPRVPSAECLPKYQSLRILTEQKRDRIKPSSPRNSWLSM